MIVAGAPPVVIVGYRVWTDRYGSDASSSAAPSALTAKPRPSSASCRRGSPIRSTPRVWRPLSSFPDIAGRRAPASGPDRRPAGPRRLRRAGASRAGRDPVDADHVPDADRTRRTIIMSAQRNLFRQGHATGADDDDGGGAGRAVDRVQSCGEPVAGAIGHARSRAVDALRARRRPGPPDPAAVGRKCPDGADGRRARRARSPPVSSRAFASEISLASGCPIGRTSHSTPALVAIITGLCLATGITFGVLPALQQSRTSLTEVLNQFGDRAWPALARSACRPIMLVGELAITVDPAVGGVARWCGARTGLRSRSPRSISTTCGSSGWRSRSRAMPACEQQRTFLRRSTNGIAAAPGLHPAALASQRAVQRPRQPRHRHGQRTVPRPVAPAATQVGGDWALATSRRWDCRS